METKQEENGVNQHRKGTIMKYTHRQWKLNKRGKWCKSTQKRDDNEIHTQTMETKQEENGVNQHRKGTIMKYTHRQWKLNKRKECKSTQKRVIMKYTSDNGNRKGTIMKYTHRQWKLNKRGKWCKSTQKSTDNEIHTQTMKLNKRKMV